MGSNWKSIDNNFPTFLGNENLREQVRLLHDFLPLLIESLKYQLNNLDSSNWNTKAKEQFQSDTTKELEDAMDTTDTAVAELIREAETIQAQVDRLIRRMNTLEADYDWQEQEMERIRQEQELIQDLTEDNAGQLDALAGFLTVNEDGTITIGGEGKTVHLAGTVYLNGSALGT